MNLQRNSYSPYELYIEENKQKNFRDIIGKYLYHWPLFVLFILISLSLAFFYLKYATPSYTVKARLLIKDEEKGLGGESALKELNLFKSATVVENELEVLKSRALVKNIVSDLGLSVRYLTSEGIKTIDLYKDSPVKLITLTMPALTKPKTIEIEIKDDKSFILKQPNSEEVVSFSSRLTSNFGVWKLVPTQNLMKFAGRTIKLVISNEDIVIDNYIKEIDAQLTSKKSTVIILSLKEKVPQRGKDVLNKLIDEYNLAAINDKNKVRQSTINFIDKRLSSLTGELTSLEVNVQNFKSSRGLTDLSSESKFFLENVKENDGRLNQVNVQLEVVSGIESYVNSPSNPGNAPATTGITDPGLIALINQLIALELKKDQLLGSSPEGSPILEPINRQINSTKQSIRENIKGIKSSLIASRNQLQRYNNNFEASIKKLPGQEREFISIKRQQSIKEELYIYLLQKREEAAVSYASTLADSRTIDQAYFGLPDSPSTLISYGFAIVAGLVLPFGLIAGRDLFNNRVSSAREIQEATEVPILGELVYQRSNSPLVMEDKNRRIIAEQFRSLRANLQYIFGKKEEGRVTLLTSGMSGEGKSFISSNLALALASAGRKTLIMECDMRKPMISKYLNASSENGMSDYLSNDAGLDDIIKVSGIHQNLFVIGAGTIPDYPSELLAKPRMKELMDWASLNFDEILIDTPPIRLVADAMILSQYSDVNLYVVRQGFTYKSQLEFVRQIFKEQKLRNLNIIFNGIEMGGANSEYEYGYYLDKNISTREAIELEVKDFLKRF